MKEKIEKLKELMLDKAINALEAGKITTVEGLEILAEMIHKITPNEHSYVKEDIDVPEIPKDSL